MKPVFGLLYSSCFLLELVSASWWPTALDFPDAPESFPVLTVSQKKLAVNPADPEFYRVPYDTDRAIYIPEKGSDSENSASNVAPDLTQIVKQFGDQGQTKPTNNKKASIISFDRSDVTEQLDMNDSKISDIYFTTIVAVGSALSVFAIIGAGFCYHRVRRNSKASEDVEYHPSYGVTGPGKESSPTSGTDRKLAQSAQMYHYQHQKQQMIAFDSANGDTNKRPNGGNSAASDCDSDDDDGEEGDYTVYECPGLAPAGEMEVHNPLFQDDPTPKATK